MHQSQFPLSNVFLALPLEGEAKQAFVGLQKRLQEFANELKFQSPDTPHLTLMFWPEVMEIEYRGIVQQMQAIADRQSPFTLKVTGISTFGERGRDRVLFLDIAFSPELALLKKSCPWTDGKPFRPHITVARIGHPERFQVHKKAITKRASGTAFAVPVSRLRLYGEVHGRKQTPLMDAPFAAV